MSRIIDVCGHCCRFIKRETRQATQEEIKRGYPKEYTVPICKKCGELGAFEVERIYVDTTKKTRKLLKNK